MNNIERVESDFTDYDVAYMRTIYGDIKSKDELIDMLNENVIVKIADRNDYETLYKDFCDFENGYPKDMRSELSYDDFITEFKKGYGNSEHVQIARYFELSNGIYYDNYYVA